jgi:hypothetical protein
MRLTKVLEVLREQEMERQERMVQLQLLSMLLFAHLQHRAELAKSQYLPLAPVLVLRVCGDCPLTLWFYLQKCPARYRSDRSKFQ